MGAFEHLLRSAKNGERADMERLLSVYAPLISRQSMVNGQSDPDLKQYLTMEFVIALMKFENFKK